MKAIEIVTPVVLAFSSALISMFKRRKCWTGTQIKPKFYNTSGFWRDFNINYGFVLASIIIIVFDREWSWIIGGLYGVGISYLVVNCIEQQDYVFKNWKNASTSIGFFILNTVASISIYILKSKCD